MSRSACEGCAEPADAGSVEQLMHQGVFAALPLSATLIDTRGVIVDVNPAFLEYAGRVSGREVQCLVSRDARPLNRAGSLPHGIRRRVILAEL